MCLRQRSHGGSQIGEAQSFNYLNKKEKFCEYNDAQK